ncbi:hypothetical protein KFL_001870280 [Klebsormidium nitens]|uniref:Reverse transcriptase domain-containing protein n=1 Tax=Klebsormidium nitens TaxID=105231 RepID=A0A1Y1I6P5_KLENI|nr:hypothetical protein KFL_001870280 [Klebsormidium nitens]|eukprot:GAQ84406.1 hypothetical protein KFL_001870280 [Klebsormidium nitens]
MNNIFKPYLRDFVVIYLDDILVYSKTEADHHKHLRLVLEKLREEKFYACLQKFVIRLALPWPQFFGTATVSPPVIGQSQVFHAQNAGLTQLWYSWTG